MHHKYFIQIIGTSRRLLRPQSSRSFLHDILRPKTLSVSLVSRSLCTHKDTVFRPHALAEVPQIDVAIIGGGLVGSSTAYWLTRRTKKSLKIAVIERDYGYTRASSMLSVGGIRHQFSMPENVQMSMFTTQFLRNIKEHLSVLDEEPPDVQFHHQGYLFLATPEKAELLEECVKVQKEVGAQTELLSRDKLSKKFPWINLEGIECGSRGLHGEGWFDPWLLVKALKQKNLNMGVHYIKGEVVSFHRRSEHLLRHLELKDENGQQHELEAGYFVNCAGPWAGEIASMAGVGQDDSFSLPVEPRKRFVYVVHCPNGPGQEAPLLVDTSGAYFRREGLGGHYLMGGSPTEESEPSCKDLEVDYSFFNEEIWPALAHRVPAFEKLKLKSAWAGFYDYNTLDQNLIVGAHPYLKNFFFGNGMSGHGVQQAVAVGNALMELIVDGKYTTIDLSRLQFDRVVAECPMPEAAIV